VHSDVWGISPVVSHARYKYFVTFIDDFNRYTWVYFLRAKSEVLSVFQNFVAYTENQFSTGIKMLRYDSGGEYMSNEFHDFLHHKRDCILAFLSSYSSAKWGAETKEPTPLRCCAHFIT
jgi:hypothetical protein